MRAKLVISAILLSVQVIFADNIFIVEVYGTDCETCPIAVKKGLQKVKGIKEIKFADINFEENRTVLIVLAEDNVNDEDILNNIKLTGKLVGKPYSGKIIKKKAVK